MVYLERPILFAINPTRNSRIYGIVYGYAFTMGSFIIATGLIGKYAETPTRGMAAAATVFLFIYVVGYVSLSSMGRLPSMSRPKA